MTSVVLGASGSLGGSLMGALSAIGENVLGVARSPRPNDVEVPNWIQVDEYDKFDPTGIDWTRAFFAFGVFTLAPILDSDEREIQTAISSNLTHQIFITRRLLQCVSKLEAKRRDVIFIGSTSAYTGYSGSSVYCATKFALRGFVESLNAEWSDTNIRFWLVSMGSMDNDMGRRVPNIPAEHLLSPSEVAKDIVNVVARDTPSFQPEIIIRRRWIK